MPRLIDADARIEEIKKAHCTNCENYGGVRCRACWVDDAIGLIDDAPTVEAVEVVRCKDCKCAYINSFSAASGVAVCKKWSNEAETAIVQHDDFCSYGERREGE